METQFIELKWRKGEEWKKFGVQAGSDNHNKTRVLIQSFIVYPFIVDVEVILKGSKTKQNADRNTKHKTSQPQDYI